MTKKIIDDVSVAAGGTTTGTFRKEPRHNVAFRIESSDDSATDSTVKLTGAKVNDADESTYGSPDTTESAANVSHGTVFRFVEVDGYEDIEVTVTNNLASGANITLYAEGYNEP